MVKCDPPPHSPILQWISYWSALQMLNALCPSTSEPAAAAKGDVNTCYLLPDAVWGKGPTNSILNSMKYSSGRIMGWSTAGPLRSWLWRWQASQVSENESAYVMNIASNDKMCDD